MSIGNIIIGQSGGPTAAINSSLAGAFCRARSMGAKKIYGMLNGVQGLLKECIVDLSVQIKDDMDIELLKRTPASFLGSCRYKLPSCEEDEKPYMQLMQILRKLDVRHFFYIGGNDSMDTVKKLSVYAKEKNIDITFIGIPKTIDNDLAITDHTPGYGSAAKFIATAVKEIVCDCQVYNTRAVTIVEIMGRNAGWLAAASALARCEDSQGPDLVYLPEVPFDRSQFLEDVLHAHQSKKSLVVAVSEGIRSEDGRYICEMDGQAEVDAFGHKNLGGTAKVLSDFILSEIGCKTRGIELNTLQRCASHIVSKTDIDESFMAGEKAVLFSEMGQTGKMITFERLTDDPYHIGISSHSIEEIANREKTIPADWITPDGKYVKKQLLKYMEPLIQGELLPIMVRGLPRHLQLKTGE